MDGECVNIPRSRTIVGFTRDGVLVAGVND